VLVFGHVASASLACHVLDRKADLRWVIFLTLLADIIDKPFGLIVFSETINNGRVWFHSLFVNLALTLVLVLCRSPLVYILALWFHQLGDRMWMRPWVALWPLSGAFGYREMALEEWVYNVFNPYNVITDIFGVIVLGWFISHYRLFDWDRFKSWLKTGVLPDVG